MQARFRLFGFIAVLALAASVTVGVGTSSASTSKTPSSNSTLIHSFVGDYYGNANDPITLAMDSGVMTAAGSCLIPAYITTSFTTSIPSNWTTLVTRAGPFQGCNQLNAYHTGDAFRVDKITTSGQKICYGWGQKASSVWYHTSRGWLWSGGTSDAVWNKSC